MIEQTLNVTDILRQVHQRQNEVVVAVEPPVAPSFDALDIFLGVGLLFKGKLSAGLNVNVLPMLCLAHDLQAELCSSVVHVLVADLHTLEHLPSERHAEVNERANQVVAATEETLLAMGMLTHQFHVFKASQHPAFNFPVSETNYVTRQSTDLLHAHQKLNTGVKVGWQTKRQPVTGVIRDEKFFDHEARRLTGEALMSLGFIRSLEGLAPAPAYQEQIPVPPYFGVDGTVLGQPIQVNTLAEPPQMRKHLSKVARALSTSLGINTKGQRSLDILQQFIDGVTP